MYNRVQEQINFAKSNNEQIILAGDFNAKLEFKSDDQNQKETKAGTMLKKLAKRNE